MHHSADKQSQKANTVASKPVRAMLRTVPSEARATPAFVLLKLDPDDEFRGDSDADPEACPGSAATSGFAGVGVERVVVVCDT
jgi:hypothetical protein